MPGDSAEPMLEQFSDVTALLQRDGMRFQADAERQRAEVPVSLGTAATSLLVVWSRDAYLVQAIVPLPISVPPDRVPAVESAIARINHALVMPGFGFDHDHRLLYFRITVPRGQGGALAADELRRLMQSAVNTARSFFDPLAGVAARGEAPETVVRRATPMDAGPGTPQPMRS